MTGTPQASSPGTGGVYGRRDADEPSDLRSALFPSVPSGSLGLLRETKMSVVDVALEVGYANPGYFSQLFRRETGLSPSDYRRQR